MEADISRVYMSDTTRSIAVSEARENVGRVPT